MATSPLVLPLELGHVCMNHFAVLDLLGPLDPADSTLIELAERICLSQIADDLLVMTDSPNADLQLRVFGADGREGDCCGNGLLLAASLYADKHGVHAVTIDMCGSNRHAKRQEIGWAVDIEADVIEDVDFSRLPSHVEPIALVRAGEPHLVIRAPREWGFFVRRIDFEAFCRPIRYSLGVEGGVNVTMVFQSDDDHTLIRTFERGAGRQTYSCGTGSVSAVVALDGDSDGSTTRVVCSPGGNHEIHHDGSNWILRGCPHPIGRGEVVGDSIRLPISGLFNADLYPDD